MCGAALAPVDRLATKANAVVFQMSADYVGSPFYPKNTQVDYQKADVFVLFWFWGGREMALGVDFFFWGGLLIQH